MSPRGKRGKPPEDKRDLDTPVETALADASEEVIGPGAVTTFPSNGDRPSSATQAPDVRVPIEEAIQQAVDELGPRSIPADVDQLVAYAQRSADICEEIARLETVFNRKNEDAKNAKKALDAARDSLYQHSKTVTHGAPLPLFDVNQAEKDRQAMLEAGENGGETEPDVDDVVNEAPADGDFGAADASA